MGKCTESIVSFYGAVFAGCFYCSLNPELPETRLKQIASVLSPSVIVTTEALKYEAANIFSAFKTVTFTELLTAAPDENALN